MLQLFSTRSDSKPVDAAQAILKGLSPDGGLYTPQVFDKIDIASLAGLSYKDLASRILNTLLPGFSPSEVSSCVDSAYDLFDDPRIAPLKKVGDCFFLELFHGPTSAFKDVALSLLPRLMANKKPEDEKILILTATSGDTGSAALKGFSGVDGINALAFYPKNGISPIQRLQMTTMKGSNITACGIDGNFDTAQTQVKRIFNSFTPKDGVRLSSANSINYGRLVPQVVYYFSSYLDLMKRGVIKLNQKVNFTVPTGNFGDILAGVFARQMGLPIKSLICACNSNNVLHQFFSSGVYNRNREFRITISPSMDILVSSNLERLLYMALDCDPSKVKSLMDELSSTGSYSLPDEKMAFIRSFISSGFATEEMTRAKIKQSFTQYDYLIDPHTAVALSVADSYRQESSDSTPMVVLSTASAFKFPQSVLSSICPEAVPENPIDQLHMLENLSSMVAPSSLRNALSRTERFTDCIKPSDMTSYVSSLTEAL